MWRRQATGTVAEILGPREIRRDVGARLFRFRKDVTAEMNHYHPDGAEIITSFVRGINAYVAEARSDSARLPVEFRLLGILPEAWTPEVVISRHAGLLGNIGAELDYGRAVAVVGAEKVKQIANFHPGDPDLTLDATVDGALLSADILGLYDAFRRPVRFEPSDVLAARDHQRIAPFGDVAMHQTEAERISHHGKRSAPGPCRSAFAALGPPERARLERGRGRRAGDSGRVYRPQRIRRLGTYHLLARRRGPLRVPDQSRGSVTIRI
jgi:penicillin amidase